MEVFSLSAGQDTEASSIIRHRLLHRASSENALGGGVIERDKSEAGIPVVAAELR
jgi:hypothetical protein